MPNHDTICLDFGYCRYRVDEPICASYYIVFDQPWNVLLLHVKFGLSQAFHVCCHLIIHEPSIIT